MACQNVCPVVFVSNSEIHLRMRSHPTTLPSSTAVSFSGLHERAKEHRRCDRGKALDSILCCRNPTVKLQGGGRKAMGEGA